MELTIYTKACCHLCEEALAAVEEVRREIPFTLVQVDIEQDPVARERYRHLIPVVTLAGEEIFYGKVSKHRLRELLLRAADRRADGEPLLSPRYAAFLARLRDLLRRRSSSP